MPAVVGCAASQRFQAAQHPLQADKYWRVPRPWLCVGRINYAYYTLHSVQSLVRPLSSSHDCTFRHIADERFYPIWPFSHKGTGTRAGATLNDTRTTPPPDPVTDLTIPYRQADSAAVSRPVPCLVLSGGPETPSGSPACACARQY